MNDASPARHDKFRAYRARKKAAGLREVRLWVPDVHSPAMQAAIARQIAEINASEEDRDALDWSDQNAAESWRELD